MPAHLCVASKIVRGVCAHIRTGAGVGVWCVEPWHLRKAELSARDTINKLRELVGSWPRELDTVSHDHFDH